LIRGTDPGVIILSRLAWALWMLGYPDQALARTQEAIALAQDSSHVYSMGFALQHAAVIHQFRREVALVQERAEAIIALAHEQGFVQWLAGGMCMRGWALIEQGVIEEGISQLRQGLADWQAMRTNLGRTHMLARLAEAYGKGGQVAKGLRFLDESMTEMEASEERHYEPEIYRLKGELILQQDREQRAGHADIEAEAYFHRALELARSRQAKSLELRAAMSLSRLWQQQGDLSAARQILTEVYDWFSEGFETPDLQEAAAMLRSKR
jgi:predicted ATPase